MSHFCAKQKRIPLVCSRWCFLSFDVCKKRNSISKDGKELPRSIRNARHVGTVYIGFCIFCVICLFCVVENLPTHIMCSHSRLPRDGDVRPSLRVSGILALLAHASLHGFGYCWVIVREFAWKPSQTGAGQQQQTPFFPSSLLLAHFPWNFTKEKTQTEEEKFFLGFQFLYRLFFGRHTYSHRTEVYFVARVTPRPTSLARYTQPERIFVLIKWIIKKNAHSREFRVENRVSPQLQKRCVSRESESIVARKRRITYEWKVSH